MKHGLNPMSEPGSIKNGEKVWLEDGWIYESYSPVNVIREAELKTEQINQNRSTRECSTEAAVRSVILPNIMKILSLSLILKLIYYDYISFFLVRSSSKMKTDTSFFFSKHIFIC